MKIRTRRFFRNPMVLLGFLLCFVASLISFSHGVADFNQNKQGFFKGNISFEENREHSFKTSKVVVKKLIERGGNSITIMATDDSTSESVYVRLYNVDKPSTFFIPGNGTQKNVGNIVKDFSQYRDINNFYQASLPNAEGLLNGVGRVNIIKLTDDEIEGEIIIMANNAEGEQAQLSWSKFKANIQ